MDQLTLIGTSGAAIILIAFGFNQTGKWKNEYLIYDLLNFIGAALLVTYAYLLSSYPFLVLNTVWGLLSLRDVFTDLSRNGKRKKMGFVNKWLK